LTQIIGKLKCEYIAAPSVDMFYLIIEACFHHGDFRMTKNVYETMERLLVRTNQRIQYLYYLHERKDNLNKPRGTVVSGRTMGRAIGVKNPAKGRA
jgi:hypothetical protein